MAGVEGTAHYSCAARLANERAYKMESPPWDIGKPHPELVRIVEEGQMKSGRVLIPGVGLGHSALFLAAKDFEVTAVDISQKAIARLERKANEENVHIQTIFQILSMTTSLREPFCRHSLLMFAWNIFR